MEATEAIFKQVLASITADTGAGGLWQTNGGVAYLKSAVRRGDSQEESLRDYPAVVIDISSHNKSPVGPDKLFFECVVTFEIYANRDAGNLGLAAPDGSIIRATLDTVLARIMTVFDNLALAALSDADDGTRKWYFNPMFRVFLGTLQSTSARVRQPVSYRLYANKGLA